MEQIEKQMKKDVNEYIRQSKKLDRNKRMTKTYKVEEDFYYRLEIIGDRMNISVYCNGKRIAVAENNNVKDFNKAWEKMEEATEEYKINLLDDFMDSFKEKIDEFIEMDELFEPFTIEEKNGNKVLPLDFSSPISFILFCALFEQYFGLDFDSFHKNFILPHLDAFNEEMSEYGTMILSNKDDKRETFAFDPTSRLGRLITHIAMGNKNQRDKEVS